MKHFKVPTTGEWVGIAFKQGDVHNAMDDGIMLGTLGQYVHCELILAKDGTARTYASYEGVGGFVRSNTEYTPDHWDISMFKLKDHSSALGICMQILDYKLPYNADGRWQCVIKAALPFEMDLDCQRPQTWNNGVFCSQVALLVLRRLHREKLVDFPEQLATAVEAFNSKGCSPNTLASILKPFFLPLVP